MIQIMHIDTCSITDKPQQQRFTLLSGSCHDKVGAVLGEALRRCSEGRCDLCGFDGGWGTLDPASTTCMERGGLDGWICTYVTYVDR